VTLTIRRKKKDEPAVFQKLFQRKRGRGDHGRHGVPCRSASDHLEKNVSYIEQVLFPSDDVKKRALSFQGKKGTLLYIESLTDQKVIQENIIEPLTRNHSDELDHLFTSVELKRENDLEKGIAALLKGMCLYFLDGHKDFLVIGAKASYVRDISEPENEYVVRGPHNGFIEDLTHNLYAVRKLVESPNLRVRYMHIGRVTQTKVAILYMQDVANPRLVKEVERRLKDISADMLMSPGFIQEFMEDKTFSPFPQILITERPDRTVSNLMDGRVAIMADGAPTALVVPVTLFAFYQSVDDYHSRWMVGSFVRVIRLLSFLVAFQLPAFYIATVSFHPEILPVDLVFRLQGSISHVPFPPLIEVISLELIFELLRESGVRLPTRVGQTIGIVGGLVIGDAIVRTGLVSYPTTIVVALTAIASFVVPSNEMSAAVRFLRFPLMLLAAIYGYYGISFGLMMISIHLCKLESFGTPYLAPLAPLRLKDMKDTFLRFPIWTLSQRPHDPHPKRMTQETVSRSWNRRDQRKK
jgi:spore germination protein KA